jgi:hypothetical protein
MPVVRVELAGREGGKGQRAGDRHETGRRITRTTAVSPQSGGNETEQLSRPLRTPHLPKEDNNQAISLDRRGNMA